MSPSHGNQQQSREISAGNQKDAAKKSGVSFKKPKAPESIPDDASFIASLKERQKESEVGSITLIQIYLFFSM